MGILMGGILIGGVLGATLMFIIWFVARSVKLKNEYIASLDDKQARKYLEFRKKVNFGME